MHNGNVKLLAAGFIAWFGYANQTSNQIPFIAILQKTYIYIYIYKRPTQPNKQLRQFTTQGIYIWKMRGRSSLETNLCIISLIEMTHCISELPGLLCFVVFVPSPFLTRFRNEISPFDPKKNKKLDLLEFDFIFPCMGSFDVGGKD